MNLKTRLRLAWAVARDVLRAPAMPTGPSGAVWGWSYGSPDKETPWGTFDDFAIGGYGGNAVVFGLIRTRMNAFSEARFRLRSLEDKRLQDPNDPALKKLAEPWPGATTGELLMRMEIDASLAGNAFVRDAGDRLERLRPDWVTIISEVEHDDMGRQVRTVVGYLYEPYGDPERGIEVYSVDEVAHWSPIPDPLASFRGMSWLTPVLTEVEADNAQTVHRGAYYRNAASPNLILKYAQKLKQEHIDAITKQVHQRHGGAENSFKTMVLDVGADPMIVGTALSDSTFSAVQAAGELRVAMASGVPPIVAGLAGGLAAGTHSNYEQAVRQFADMTLRPNWRGACAALAKLIDVPDGMELWFDAGDVALLQEGENSQATTFQVKAATISTLIQTGCEPESVFIAVKAGDESLLKHTGLVSVQMHNANEPENKPEPAPAQRAIERRFDPNQPRDANGKFVEIPGLKLKAPDEPRRQGKDALKLAGKIQLAPGETLISSSKVDGDSGGIRMALTDQGGRRRLRLGVGGEAYGKRIPDEGIKAWDGNPTPEGLHEGERERLDAEYEALSEEFESASPERTDEIEARQEKIRELLVNDDVFNGTAKLDEYSMGRLATKLRPALDEAVEQQGVEDQAYAELEIEQGKAKPDPGRVAELKKLARMDPNEPDYQGIVFDKGIVRGEWGDVHYRVELDDLETGAYVLLGVKPEGAEDNWGDDLDWMGRFDEAETRKFLRLLGQYAG